MIGSDLLSGVRVVDLSRVLAGPFAAQVLAGLGADVVKVESPDGDPARDIGPHVGDRSLYFSSLNNGKRGVVLDLATTPGRRALEALLDTAEIVVENFRPDAADRLGCAPADLLKRHPSLVVVTVSGYARDSDRAGSAAFDLTAQAESGIMSVTGMPGSAPVRAGVPVADLAAGLWAALGAVAAYTRRLRDGKGSHVEVPLLDASLSLLSYVGTTAAWTGEDPGRVGSGHHSVVPYGAYPTADGWIVLAVIGEKFWPLACEALDLDALAAREELAQNSGRLERRGEVDAAIAAKLAELTSSDALARLRRVGVPSAPVNTVLDALDAPYVRDRGLVTDVSAPEGSYRVVQGPVRALRSAPSLGEHTTEVLAEVLGADSSLLAALPVVRPRSDRPAHRAEQPEDRADDDEDDPDGVKDVHTEEQPENQQNDS